MKIRSLQKNSQDDPIHKILAESTELYSKIKDKIPENTCENIEIFLQKALEVHLRLKIEISIAGISFGDIKIDLSGNKK